MNSTLLRCLKCADQKVSNRWSFEPCVPVLTAQTCVRRLPPRQWLGSQSNWCHLLSGENDGSNRRRISNPDFIDHHRNYAIASVIDTVVCNNKIGLRKIHQIFYLNQPSTSPVYSCMRDQNLVVTVPANILISCGARPPAATLLIAYSYIYNCAALLELRLDITNPHSYSVSEVGFYHLTGDGYPRVTRATQPCVSSYAGIASCRYGISSLWPW